MAIGWLSVLKAVPWTEVITNAPKVADGAKKLWNSVGKKAAPQTAGAAASTVAPDELATRLAAVESAARDLHEQMLASSEVIKALAEQNAQLISGIEAMRIRQRWLGRAVIALGIISVAGLVWSLLR